RPQSLRLKSVSYVDASCLDFRIGVENLGTHQVGARTATTGWKTSYRMAFAELIRILLAQLMSVKWPPFARLRNHEFSVWHEAPSEAMVPQETEIVDRFQELLTRGRLGWIDSGVGGRLMLESKRDLLPTQSLLTSRAVGFVR